MIMKLNRISEIFRTMIILYQILVIKLINKIRKTNKMFLLQISW